MPRPKPLSNEDQDERPFEDSEDYIPVIIEDDEGNVNHSYTEEDHQQRSNTHYYADRRPAAEDDEIDILEEATIRAQERSREAFLSSWKIEHGKLVDTLESVQTRKQMAMERVREAINAGSGEDFQVYQNIVNDYNLEEANLSAQIKSSNEAWQIETAKLPFQVDRDLVNKKAAKFLRDFESEFGRPMSADERAKLEQYENQIVAQNPNEHDPRRKKHWDHLMHIARENFSSESNSMNKSSNQRRGPAVGMPSGSSGRNERAAAGNSKKPFNLKPAHLHALEQLGIDNPKSKEAQRYIKRWQEYDPEAAKERFWSVGG